MEDNFYSNRNQNQKTLLKFMLKKILITFALPFNPILSPNYELKT